LSARARLANAFQGTLKRCSFKHQFRVSLANNLAIPLETLYFITVKRKTKKLYKPFLKYNFRVEVRPKCGVYYWARTSLLSCHLIFCDIGPSPQTNLYNIRASFIIVVHKNLMLFIRFFETPRNSPKYCVFFYKTASAYFLPHHSTILTIARRNSIDKFGQARIIFSK